MKIAFTITILLFLAPADADWFDDLKKTGTANDLYRTLYYMPKGGDLHNHLSGSNFAEWWYDEALLQRARGYRYYTKVRIENCVDYGGNAYGRTFYYLMFRNIMENQFENLTECEKREYKRLEDLDDKEKAAWSASIRLDKPHEGRDEFFGTHWSRLNALTWNPWLQAEMLYLNMQAFGAEGLTYIEPQFGTSGFVAADGSAISPQQVIEIMRDRTMADDALATGVNVRMQVFILRFLPSANETLRDVYKLVHDNNDFLVAVNMVGREDNGKGHPRRFLETLRDLRRQYSGVRLSIHAGESDEPNSHVRDTLLLGADRIGHGVNLIKDDDTMLRMRHGPYLVEINLISNLLLQYVSSYEQHPFPEYLRTGIPVALSTDDRGMWDSTLTDEFFVAVSEFNLSWNEIKTLSRNSLQYSFAPPSLRQELVDDFDERMRKFESKIRKYGLTRLGPMPTTRQFICSRYQLCSK